MGFLSSIKNGLNDSIKAVSKTGKSAVGSVKKIVNSTAKGVEKAGKGVYDKVLVPGYEKGLKPAVNKVVEEVGKQIDRTDRILDSASDGVGSLLKNPFLTIGLGIGALIVLSSVMKK